MDNNIFYPIGLQDFGEIRRLKCAYLDKTDLIYKIVTDGGKYFFISRPRRFGKSLLLSTMDYLFRSQRELFKGLAIDSLPWDWQEYPVLHLDLNVSTYDNPDSLDDILNRYLDLWEAKYNVDKHAETYEGRFMRIIRTIAETTGRQVVILIDEYDKPMFSTLHDKALHNKYRVQLQAFYSVIKSMDKYIRFAMLTGVNRFSKVSIFSGLNNLIDISLESAFNGLCGITQQEVDEYFPKAIEALATANDISFEQAKEELKMNYNGYHFSPSKQGIYNPFSLMSALRSKTIDNYWFETGTPSFLVKLLKAKNYDLSSLEDTTRSSISLKGSDENLNDIASLFYQTGYLTIKNYDRMFNEYTLGYPNKEVKQSLLKYLIPYYSPDVTDGAVISEMVRAVMCGDIGRFMKNLSVFFDDFPYEQIPALEVHFQNVVYIILKLMGFYVRTEYHTSCGRIDMTIETEKYVYVIEFKLGNTPVNALKQIHEKGYCRPYLLSGKHIICIGVCFSPKTRSLHAWEAVDGPLA